MKEQILKYGWLVIFAPMLTACEAPVAETQAEQVDLAELQAEQRAQMNQPRVVQEVAGFDDFDCPRSEAVYAALQQAVVSNTMSPLQNIALAASSPEMLYARELLDGQDSELSYYDRMQFDHCVGVDTVTPVQPSIIEQ